MVKEVCSQKKKRCIGGEYKRTASGDSHPIMGSRRRSIKMPTGGKYAARRKRRRYNRRIGQAGHRDHNSGASYPQYCPSCESWERGINRPALPLVRSFVLPASLILHNLKLVYVDKGIGVDFFPLLHKGLNILLGTDRYTRNLFKPFVEARQVDKILGMPLAFVRA